MSLALLQRGQHPRVSPDVPEEGPSRAGHRQQRERRRRLRGQAADHLSHSALVLRGPLQSPTGETTAAPPGRACALHPGDLNINKAASLLNRRKSKSSAQPVRTAPRPTVSWGIRLRETPRYGARLSPSPWAALIVMGVCLFNQVTFYIILSTKKMPLDTTEVDLDLQLQT